mgnify:CR=1 FL=1
MADDKPKVEWDKSSSFRERFKDKWYGGKRRIAKSRVGRGAKAIGRGGRAVGRAGKYAWSGKEGKGGIMRVAKPTGAAALKGKKAIGKASAKVGGYASKKIGAWWSAGKEEPAIGLKWWIISLVIGALMFVFIGWMAAVYVMTAILILKLSLIHI